jgi:hypothetical protein
MGTERQLSVAANADLKVRLESNIRGPRPTILLFKQTGRHVVREMGSPWDWQRGLVTCISIRYYSGYAQVLKSRGPGFFEQLQS